MSMHTSRAHPPGRVHVERVEDLVLVVQEGYFEPKLMDELCDRAEDATKEALAQHGTCVHVADVRALVGTSMRATIKFEFWMSQIAPSIAMTAVISDSTAMRMLLSMTGLFIGNLPFAIASDMAEALRIVGRERLEARVAQALAGISRIAG